MNKTIDTVGTSVLNPGDGTGQWRFRSNSTSLVLPFVVVARALWQITPQPLGGIAAIYQPLTGSRRRKIVQKLTIFEVRLA